MAPEDFSDLPTWPIEKLLVVARLDNFTLADIRKLTNASRLQSSRILDSLRKRGVVEKIDTHVTTCLLNNMLLNAHPTLKSYKSKPKYKRTAIGNALALHIEQQLKGFVENGDSV